MAGTSGTAQAAAAAAPIAPSSSFAPVIPSSSSTTTAKDAAAARHAITTTNQAVSALRDAHQRRQASRDEEQRQVGLEGKSPNKPKFMEDIRQELLRKVALLGTRVGQDNIKSGESTEQKPPAKKDDDDDDEEQQHEQEPRQEEPRRESASREEARVQDNATQRPNPVFYPPYDLSHHFSANAKAQLIREPDSPVVNLLRLVGVADLSSGLPNDRFCPIRTLKATTALPTRFVPSPNYPEPPVEPLQRPTSSPYIDPMDAITAAVSAATSYFSPAKPKENLATAHVTVADFDPSAIASSSAFASRDRTNPVTTLDWTAGADRGGGGGGGGLSGYPSLTCFLRDFVRNDLHPIVPYFKGPEIALTCGEMDGLSKVLDMFDTGVGSYNNTRDRYLLSEPYLDPSVIALIKSRGIKIVPVLTDGEGMMPHGMGGLQELLRKWDTITYGMRPMMLYISTMGNNPAGTVMPLQRRLELYDLCKEYDIIIIEDEPCWHLQFASAKAYEFASRADLPIPAVSNENTQEISGREFLDSLAPSFLKIDTQGRVIRLDSFSYSVAPDFQLGWITAQPAFIELFERITRLSARPSALARSAMAAFLTQFSNTPSSTVFSSPSTFLSRMRTSPSIPKSSDGFVRWLEGLRGSYEARMCRVCSILEAGTHQIRHGTPTATTFSDWRVLSKSRVFTFNWPRGGHAVWIKVHFDTHPCWHQRIGMSAAPFADERVLGATLLLFLSKDPYQVCLAPGTTFAAMDDVATQTHAASFLRLSFASEDEHVLSAATGRFVKGIHMFWRASNLDLGQLWAQWL